MQKDLNIPRFCRKAAMAFSYESLKKPFIDQAGSLYSHLVKVKCRYYLKKFSNSGQSMVVYIYSKISIIVTIAAKIVVKMKNIQGQQIWRNLFQQLLLILLTWSLLNFFYDKIFSLSKLTCTKVVFPEPAIPSTRIHGVCLFLCSSMVILSNLCSMLDWEFMFQIFESMAAAFYLLSNCVLPIFLNCKKLSTSRNKRFVFNASSYWFES